jgi:hypothetical protein
VGRRSAPTRPLSGERLASERDVFVGRARSSQPTRLAGRTDPRRARRRDPGIDNGEIERVLKKPCVGRKNYLRAGSVAGAKRLAAAYTPVLSCKGLGINVNDYLVDVITKLAAGWPLRRIRELVPDAWAAA